MAHILFRVAMIFQGEMVHKNDSSTDNKGKMHYSVTLNNKAVTKKAPPQMRANYSLTKIKNHGSLE